jgi:beta-phosphoglucomutase-like phosphatase (HAD superfamily)
MSELQAVLLDVDGTLSETERHGHLVAVNQAFSAVGLDWQWSAELYGELLKVTGSTERINHFVATYQPQYRHINEDLDELIAEIVKHKNANYKRIAESGEIPLRPGVERVLREIHDSDVRMGIATTTTPQNVDALLLGNIGGDVLDWFEVIAAGNMVPDKKPAPDIYTYALEKMNLQPANCLAIEDSENGVRSALAAGLPVLVIESEYSTGHDLSGAKLIVDQWGTAQSPMKVLSGNAGNHQMVTLELMKQLMAAIN